MNAITAVRADKLRSLLEDDEAVMISGYPSIFYYSSFTSPDAYLLISHDKKYIITDSRYTIQAGEQAADFELIDSARGMNFALSKLHCRVLGYEEDYMTVSDYRRMKRECPDGCEVVPMQKKISEPRRRKDEDEIKRIAEAERLGDAAFSHILKKIKAGVTEREIALELEFFMKKNGASALSFETIVASGKRGAMPHGTASDKKIENGDFVTMDFGCVLDGYCSDMTRTVAVGRVQEELKEIYDVVLRAQIRAISEIAVSKKCSDIDAAARQVIGDAGYGKCFGHGLGHSVGIEIHESPSFSPKSRDLIENGNVITVEPGIYVEGLGGVRIEDVIAIRDSKAINLTGSEKSLIVL